MTPGQARDLLEVDDAATADALRRAYLRKIKQHKPERDPAGFQRCREAYELLTRWLPRPASSAPHAPALDLDGDMVSADRPPASAPHPVNVVVAAVDTAAVSWLERADREDDIDARIALLAEAVDALPMDATLVLELEAELRGAGSPDRALAVLRRAHARGVKGLDARLFAAHAARLDDEELAHLIATRPPRYRQTMVTALLARDRASEARSVVEEAVAPLNADVAEWIAPAFSFYEQGDVPSAKRVTAALRARLDAQQAGSKIPPQVRLRLVLLFELAAVADELPEAVTAAIARGLRLGDLRGAESDLADFAAGSHSRAGALKVLEERAPALAGRFGPMLAARERTQPTAGGGVSRWFIVAVVLAVMRLAGSTCSGMSREHRTVSVPSMPVISAPVEVVTARNLPPTLCIADLRTCRALARLSDALDRGRCLEVERLRLTAQRAHAELSPARRDLDRLVEEMEARALMECSTTDWTESPAPDPEPPDDGANRGAPPRSVIWEDHGSESPAAVR